MKPQEWLYFARSEAHARAISARVNRSRMEKLVRPLSPKQSGQKNWIVEAVSLDYDRLLQLEWFVMGVAAGMGR